MDKPVFGPERPPAMKERITRSQERITRLTAMLNQECAKQGHGLVLELNSQCPFAHMFWYAHAWTEHEKHDYLENSIMPRDDDTMNPDAQGLGILVFDASKPITDNSPLPEIEVDVMPDLDKFGEGRGVMCLFDGRGDGDLRAPSVNKHYLVPAKDLVMVTTGEKTLRFFPKAVGSIGTFVFAPGTEAWPLAWR